MIKNHVKVLITQNLSITPSACQLKVIDGFCDFVVSDQPDIILLMKGFAGTGKTTLINGFARTLTSLKINPVLMAPTGRAAKVMAGYTSMPAYTIHKKIYRQQSSADGTGRFVLDKNLHKNSWFIVDEASMIANSNSENSLFGSGNLLEDLLEYVYSGFNCRLILSGDTAQLPPVGYSTSPALEAAILLGHGFQVSEYILTEVVRQSIQSGILFNATKIRNRIEADHAVGYFRFNTEEYTDIERISGEELIECITTSYQKYGLYDTTIVTRSNKRANLYNRGVRGSILYRENEIERGDLLMIVKNNYYWGKEDSGIDFIANGEMAEVVSIYGYEEMYGFRFADVRLRIVDYDDIEIDCKIFLDSLSIETASFTFEQNRKLFEQIAEDYTDITNKRARWKKIRENPYFNAMQVKYAYAITCHKAQGGQWKAVLVDHGYLTEDMLDQDYYRWLYTAITRPVEKLYLVNFDKKFFDLEDD